MKKILLILFVLVGINFAQDVTTTMGWNTYSFTDTLTATIDSIRVNGIHTGNVFTITAYTTTGTDTVNIYTLPKGYTVWAQKSLTDLTSGNLVTQIIATTTPKEYLVSDPDMVSMLLVTPDVSASCVVIVSKKSGEFVMGFDPTDINASLDNIEADADSIVDETTVSAASLAIIDDWDESDRAKVNPIVGQAGVAANRGTAGATTQRVTIANDDTTSTLQTAIKAAVETIDNAISGNEILIAGGATQTNDVKVTLDGEAVAVSGISGNSVFSGGAIAVTTAVQLSANQACKTVTITNYTAGEYVYVLDASVTTANGQPLGYLDSITLTVSNLNLVYVVSDGTSCDIRYSYEN